MSKRNIEQERVRKVIYLNLDRLFEDLNELNQNTTTKEANLKREMKKQ